MSQLTHMRQHIKAVQTIKKITQAMRLISMSIHSRIKQLEEPLFVYQKTVLRLFLQARVSASHLNHQDISTTGHNKQSLIILIGSQKGLCGSFNTALFSLFDKNITNQPDYTLITVGKRATQHVQKNYAEHLIAFYNTLSLHNVLGIAHNLLQEINQHGYTTVTIYSNTSPSFFLQKPSMKQLMPVILEKEHSSEDISYDWEQPPQEVLTFLMQQYLLSQIQHALFQSLLAEHAARFISMDSSTRNANNMLEDLQLTYNKLRQAKITRELTELSSFFLS